MTDAFCDLSSNADWHYVKALFCYMTTLTTALRWTSTISFLPAKVPGNTCIPGISASLPKQDFESGALRKMLSCLTLQCDA